MYGLVLQKEKTQKLKDDSCPEESMFFSPTIIWLQCVVNHLQKMEDVKLKRTKEKLHQTHK